MTVLLQPIGIWNCVPLYSSVIIFFENIFFLNEENPMPIVPGKNGTQFELVVVLRGLFRHCRGLRIGFRRQQRRLVPEKPSKTRYMPINIEETCLNPF